MTAAPVVADPARSAADWLDAIKEQEREGDLFHAFDLARRGIAQHPDDLALKHRAVLCLASTGATDKAWQAWQDLGLDRLPATAAPGASLSLDLDTLQARLLKDASLALPASAERRAKLGQAADLYEAAAQRARAAGNDEAYYPTVNAATLRLLAGDAARAAALAHDTIAQVTALGQARLDYYALASLAEAHLVVGEIAAAGELALAARRFGDFDREADFRALASTLRQFKLILSALRMQADWMAQLAPPKVMHYLGHMIAPPGAPGRFRAEWEGTIAERIAERLGSESIGFGYGALAAGADILFAEALLARGASLHVVLPFREDEFIATSVAPSGAGWVERYGRCRARATSLRFATEDSYLGDQSLFAYGAQLAMGLALLRAQHISAEIEQIALWDGLPPAGLAGTAVDVKNWRHSGKKQIVIPCGDGTPPPQSRAAPARTIERRTRAMLFGDVKGFSKLTDAQLPLFVEHILGACARVIETYRRRDAVLLANTWGDGLYLVFDRAGEAARCALDLQAAMAALDLPALGLPEMGLRIGGHLGPVYMGIDPVLGTRNFFGSHVSRAARVEPVTPEGCVYVTETFASILALYDAEEFRCQYVGMTQAAKDYGAMRMFLLGRGGGI